uniref:Uncharacterized protein n=1 Tax=Cacopsylla melanoneura TaxID=428564 RepID=A0A8D8SB06_9HEMI
MSSFRGSVISLIIVSVIRGSSVFIIRIVKSIIRMSRGLVSGTISFNEWGTSGIRVMSARWTSGIRMVGTSWHGRSWKPKWRKRSPWRQTMGWGSWSGWFSFWKICGWFSFCKIHGWIVAMSVLRIVRIGVIVTRVHFIIVSIFLHSA